MASNLLSRRGFVQNTALMALLAPVLRRRDAFAQSASPRRAVFVFSPNGICPMAGPASGSENTFQIMDYWKALERHKAEGIFISHMAATGAGQVSGGTLGAHGIGAQIFNGGGAAGDMDSVDQVIGKRLEAQGKAGLKRSVNWGTLAASGLGAPFASGGRKIPGEVSPQRAWAELFANFMAPVGGDGASAEQIRRAEALIAQEKSVLDFVNTTCRSLRDALGREGTILLDEHCTTLRSMEESLKEGFAQPGAAAANCKAPPAPGNSIDWANPENIDAQAAAFVDLIATSFACELTRVVGFQFGGGAARNRIASKYGVPSSARVNSGDSGPAHHPWTHNGASANKTKAIRIFTEFYASKVALLLDKLKKTNDANGKPLMDSTVVVWSSELGGSKVNADSHQMGCIPVMFFGNGQGTFKTGRYIRGKTAEVRMRTDDPMGKREAGRDHARLLVSICHYMGLTDINSVGRSDGTGPWRALYG
jgi:hypothetical protein